MMAKPRKDGKYVNLYMDRELAERLDQYSAETGIPKTFVIEKSVQAYLAQHESAAQEKE